MPCRNCQIVWYRNCQIVQKTRKHITTFYAATFHFYHFDDDLKHIYNRSYRWDALLKDLDHHRHVGHAQRTLQLSLLTLAVGSKAGSIGFAEATVTARDGCKCGWLFLAETADGLVHTFLGFRCHKLKIFVRCFRQCLAHGNEPAHIPPRLATAMYVL